MNEQKIIAGLDIGTTKVACIVGRQAENGKIEILGYGKTPSTGVKRGVVINIIETTEAIKKAVKAAEDDAGVNIKRVSVGIAGQHIKSLQHHGVLLRSNSEKEISEVELEKMRNDTCMIKVSPGEEIIDVIRQDTFVDGELANNPVGMLGNKIDANFHVIIAQTTAVKNIVNCVKAAELEYDFMILEPVASAQAVLDEEEKEAGVILVDMGGGTTDIAIFKDGKIQHSAVIPLGGDIISEDICKGCTIMRRYAEEVKVKFGSALASANRNDEVVSIPGIRGHAPKEISFENLAGIIQARLEEIFDLVRYEIQNVRSSNQLIAGIVLTGGGAMMKHIQQLAELKTGCEVRIGYPNEHLAPTEIKDMSSPMYSTGIGLIIETIARMEQKKKLEAAEECKVETKKEESKTIELQVPELPIEKTEKNEHKGIFGIITRLTKAFTEDIQ